ncbi:MAG: DUF2971 domain-containing protein [Rectinemataceae bacterium]|nr:DUF2971 domain-containing protein [Rectinemataceae bacterium]
MGKLALWSNRISDDGIDMRLYKYCDAGGIEILRGCSIKVSAPSELNDPFDCNPVPDTSTPASREALRGMIINASQLLPKAIEGSLAPPPGMSRQQLKEKLLGILDARLDDPEFVRMASEHLSTATGLLCLSAAKSHHLMWAHYADRHQGLVIEFDLEGIFQTTEDVNDLKSRTLHKVQYSDVRPSYRFDQLNPSVILTKGTAWEYEAEWRVLFLLKDVPQQVVAGRQMRLHSIPPSCIKAVYLGNRMPDMRCQEVRQLCDQEYLRHIDIYQMELDHQGYLMVPRLVRPAN